ncbi:hypothetical protein EYF80_013403 [Liparis tanakae]|uniref:Secreted protein n=1 Tax=Liparis tanakae TaxID=230148 RepID=A0A4Z2IFZ2_9TELE|nr:hypothetical protein EYF80_013403 [Liparis tanakae]
MAWGSMMVLVSCWSLARLKVAEGCGWDPAVPVEDERLGAGTKEQLLVWEDGVAELDEDEADDEEEAAAAPEAPAADIPPPLPPPPMVES